MLKFDQYLFLNRIILSLLFVSHDHDQIATLNLIFLNIVFYYLGVLAIGVPLDLGYSQD